MTVNLTKNVMSSSFKMTAHINVKNFLLQLGIAVIVRHTVTDRSIITY